MIRPPPHSTLTVIRFPYSTFFRHVPPDESLAARLAAEQHDLRRPVRSQHRRRVAAEDEHLARRVIAPFGRDASFGNVARPFGMALRQADPGARLQADLEIEQRRVRLHRTGAPEGRPGANPPPPAALVADRELPDL